MPISARKSLEDDFQGLFYIMKFLTINQATTDAAMPTMTGSE
jgi:hypothetical protein